MQNQKFVPVTQSDSDEVVLERILDNIEQAGEVDLDTLIEGAELYKHPYAEKILRMALKDGMLRLVDQARGIVSINQIGRDVAKRLRSSKAGS